MHIKLLLEKASFFDLSLPSSPSILTLQRPVAIFLIEVETVIAIVFGTDKYDRRWLTLEIV